MLDAPVVTNADNIPEGFEVAVFGLGCFWGAEEIFWRMPGVWSTSVGYAGGTTPHPSYDEVCSGLTGHTEAVRVVFDPTKVAYADLVKAFFEFHDPTQGMRQGNDVGTQYRSAVYTLSDEQVETAKALRAAYEPLLLERGYGAITTEIKPAPTYYYAEDVHQQYLAKNPNGYRCHSATGVPFPARPSRRGASGFDAAARPDLGGSLRTRSMDSRDPEQPSPRWCGCSRRTSHGTGRSGPGRSNGAAGRPAAHVAHDLLAYAGQVAAQPGSAYLPFDLVIQRRRAAA